MLGGGGRFGRGVNSTKSYSVISVCGLDSSLCFGSVGVGTASFCVRKHCGVKAHVDSKVDVWEVPDETRVFIMRPGSATVFTEPSIAFDRVPEDVWTNWQSQQYTLAEWNREFCAVEITNDAFATIAEIKEEASFLAKAKDFRTPSKRAREATKATNESSYNTIAAGLSSGMFVTHVRMLPVVATEEELEEMVEGSGVDALVLAKVVSQVETSIVALGETLGMVSEQTGSRFADVDREAKLVAGAVHTLSSILGTPIELDDRFEAPTLWGTAAFIADELIRLSKDALAVELLVKPMQSEVDWIKTSVRESHASAEEAGGKMRQILTFVMKRIHEIAPEVELVKTRLGVVEQDIARGGKESKRHRSSAGGLDRDGSEGDHQSKGSGSSMDDLLRMLDVNAIGTPPGSGSQRRIGTPLSAARRELLGSMEITGEDQNETLGGSGSAAVLRQLVTEVAMLKVGALESTVKFGGLGLRSIQDCQAWINENFACYRYGLIMDPLLMLDRIWGDDGLGNKANQLKTWESRVKLGITTGAEEAALQAILVKRPQLFHSGKTAMVSERNKSRLSQLPNFAAWKSGGEGVRNYVVRQMNVIYSTLSQEIGYALGFDPALAKANALAVRSLNDTITFITQLLNFVDTMYERLNSESKFTSDQAWSLTTQILDRICEELYAPKEGVGGAMKIEAPESVCCHILWAAFKTHDIMATYIDKNFENHPVISAEYIKFLATNSGIEKVEKIEVQLNAA